MRTVDRCRVKPLMQWMCIALMASAMGPAFAHEPVAKCIWLDGATVRCRGGNNDGDDAPGARMEVLSLGNQVLVNGTLDAQSTLTFAKPAQAFYVLFTTGPGLQVTVEQEEIEPLPQPRRRARWMQP